MFSHRLLDIPINWMLFVPQESAKVQRGTGEARHGSGTVRSPPDVPPPWGENGVSLLLLPFPGQRSQPVSPHLHLSCRPPCSPQTTRPRGHPQSWPALTRLTPGPSPGLHPPQQHRVKGNPPPARLLRSPHRVPSQGPLTVRSRPASPRPWRAARPGPPGAALELCLFEGWQLFVFKTFTHYRLRHQAAEAAPLGVCGLCFPTTTTASGEFQCSCFRALRFF